MTFSPPERDWKYILKIKNDLLASLCTRINHESMDILREGKGSEYDRYRALYRHIEKSDRIIGDCFNDFKRSNLLMKLIHLQFHQILKDEHVANLSPETRAKLEALAAF
ncbi:hypothetical protein [Desulfonatronovibrio magnus]|uniref:hypothetical protein n=1 Tax=Desulfonatronovibrio magnus TaxID=698827 RepID=UPI0005EADAB7|nr:hypothetical protein [Desulfonatronovibrio magnus]